MTAPAAQIDWGQGVSDAWAGVAAFVPKFAAFVVILLVGLLVSRVLERVTVRLLARVGLERAAERGGVRRNLARAGWDASTVLGRIVFLGVALFSLQLAFGVFGPNPVSELLTGVVAFLPKLFVALVIVVVAAAVGSIVRQIVDGSLAGLSYGRALARTAGGAVVAIGVFAALNHVEVAPEIVNGLFYALLAVVAGSAIVAIGGGGIQPMRTQWEKVLTRAEEDIQKVDMSAGSVTQRFEAPAQPPPPTEDLSGTRPVPRSYPLS